MTVAKGPRGRRRSYLLFLFHQLKKRGQEGGTDWWHIVWSNTVCACCAVLCYSTLRLATLVGSSLVPRRFIQVPPPGRGRGRGLDRCVTWTPTPLPYLQENNSRFLLCTSIRYHTDLVMGRDPPRHALHESIGDNKASHNSPQAVMRHITSCVQIHITSSRTASWSLNKPSARYGAGRVGTASVGCGFPKRSFAVCT